MPMWMIGGWIVPGGLSCRSSCKRPAKVVLLHAIIVDAMIYTKGALSQMLREINWSEKQPQGAVPLQIHHVCA